MNETPYKIGRVVQHDPRSRSFPIKEVDPEILKSVRWMRNAEVFDQGDLGSCTGNACLGALATGPVYTALKWADKMPPYTQAEAVRIYSAATKIDEWEGEYPPTDTGSSGLAVAKVVQSEGKIAGYNHAFTFNAALTGLAQGPVITGVNWYSSFFYPTIEGECRVDTSAVLSGGHEIVMDELDMENKRVWFTNSWGPLWGKSGRAYFTFETWQRLLAEQGDVTQFVPLSLVQPEPQPKPSPEPTGCLLAAPKAIRRLLGR